MARVHLFRHSPAIGGRSRQRGVVGIGSAMVVLLLMLGMLGIVLERGGRVATDSVVTQDQTAALFQAESGVERAHGVLTRAAAQGTSLAAACQSLAQTEPLLLGSGHFVYRRVDVTQQSCTTGGGNCQFCDFLIEGARGEARRTLQARFDISNQNGVTGIGSRTQPLVLKVEHPGAAALMNVAFVTRYSTDSANASLAGCLAGAGGAITGCSRSWDDINNGNDKVTGAGVLAAGLGVGSYSIEAGFQGTGGTPLPRPYALTGALLYPPQNAPPVAQLGSTLVTRPSVSPLAFAPPLCAPLASFPQIDTAIYGFSSIRTASEAAQLAQIAVASSGQSAHLQMHRLLHRDSPAFAVSGVNHHLYSQFWYAYNRAYSLPAGATATGAAGSSTISISGSDELPRHGTVLGRPGVAAFAVLNLNVSWTGSEIVDTSSSLRVGDAVFAPIFPLDTWVEADLGGGRYRLSLTDAPPPVAALPIVARARVISRDPSGRTVALSRPLLSAFTATTEGQLCGGLCALITNATGVQDLRFVLSGPGITDSTKWASGYACFSGVDPDRRIRPIHGLPRRTLWAEVIR